MEHTWTDGTDETDVMDETDETLDVNQVTRTRVASDGRECGRSRSGGEPRDDARASSGPSGC
jgi:hypothetical protein